MNRKDFINELTSISLLFSNYDSDVLMSNFSSKLIRKFKNNIENWINNFAKSENIEIYVSKQQLDDIGYSIDDIENKIVPIKVIDETVFRNMVRKAFEYEDFGPGFDSVFRDQNSWNDNYFYTGSDATFYTLYKKI